MNVSHEQRGSNRLEDEYFGLLGEFGHLLHQHRQEYSAERIAQTQEMDELCKAAFHNYDDPLGEEAAYSVFLRLDQRENSRYNPFDDYEFLAPILEMISEQVIYAAKRSPHPLRTDVFVGEIPGADFNAATLARAPNGSLILVNSGLPLAIHQLSKIVALGAWFVKDDPLASDIRSGKMIGPPLIDLLAIVLQYAIFRDSRSLTLDDKWRIISADDPADRRDIEALYDFIQGWRSVAIRPEIDPYSMEIGGCCSRRRLVGMLDRYCLSFVLAHEAGHVIGGHATSSEPPRV